MASPRRCRSSLRIPYQREERDFTWSADAIVSISKHAPCSLETHARATLLVRWSCAMKHSEPGMRTVEGLSWPIVLFAELVGARADAWRQALEDASMIVLSEASVLRAAVVVASERPHVVVVPSSVPTERTRAVRDAARAADAELLALPFDAPPADVRLLVEKAIEVVRARRRCARPR